MDTLASTGVKLTPDQTNVYRNPYRFLKLAETHPRPLLVARPRRIYLAFDRLTGSGMAATAGDRRAGYRIRGPDTQDHQRWGPISARAGPKSCPRRGGT